MTCTLHRKGATQNKTPQTNTKTYQTQENARINKSGNEIKKKIQNHKITHNTHHTINKNTQTQQHIKYKTYTHKKTRLTARHKMITIRKVGM